MHTQTIIYLSIGAVITLVIAALIVLAPGRYSTPFPAATPIEASEHARTVKEMGSPRHERPVIAIVALNQATEVTDLMVPYGVLTRADVADVVVVAEQTTPVPLYPFSKLGQGSELFKVTPQSSLKAFDEKYPDGADYVVVPALQPRNDRVVVDWINAQHRQGANVVSVCAGALTLAATGLLDDRSATTHWSYIEELQKAHPSTHIVRDRRYVSDRGVTTATGISASLPTTVALVEAIAGQPKAQQVAEDLGLTSWDERHRSSAFKLTWERQKTFLRNWLSFWRHQTIGVPVVEKADEVALALTADAYSRTMLSKVVTVGSGNESIHSLHGLVIHPNTTQTPAAADMLPAPNSDTPARILDRELNRIAARFDRPTAEIVALTIEYPWAPKD